MVPVPVPVRYVVSVSSASPLGILLKTDIVLRRDRVNAESVYWIAPLITVRKLTPTRNSCLRDSPTRGGHAKPEYLNRMGRIFAHRRTLFVCGIFPWHHDLFRPSVRLVYIPRTGGDMDARVPRGKKNSCHIFAGAIFRIKNWNNLFYDETYRSVNGSRTL